MLGNDNTPEFDIAIGNVVNVPVKFTLTEKGVQKSFSHTLICNRLDQSEINARLTAFGNKMDDFLSKVPTTLDDQANAAGVKEPIIIGWTGQRLVIDRSTGQPAEFSERALDAMLKVAGVASVSFSAYMSDVGAKQKN